MLHIKAFNPEGEEAGLKGCTADVFIFNDDAFGRIDSYQRLETGPDGTIDVASRKGRKTAVVICNPQYSDYDWNSISSLESISGLRCDLRREDPDAPLMCGVMKIDASDDSEFAMQVSPLLSEIFIRSVRCDFSGRPYSGCLLENAHAYLANINSVAGIMDTSIPYPAAPVNTDGLPDESDRILAHPDMVHAVFGTGIGHETVYPDIRLYCYPNNSTEDTAGNPFTRLVIAGDIDGRRYYYPLDINHGQFGDTGGLTGIGRNCRYVFDIVLRQTGVTDPTIPVSGETAVISGTVEPWDKRPESGISF